MEKRNAKCVEKRVVALTAAFALTISGITVQKADNAQAASKAPTLSASSISLKKGQTKKIKINANKQKITKVTWKVDKSKLKITKKTKKYAVVKALKTGSASISVTIVTTKKTYTKKVKAKIKKAVKNTPKPEVTKAPDNTKAPNTQPPADSSNPAVSADPGISSAPAESNTPDESKTPDETTAPDESKAPDNTTAPAVSNKPAVSYPVTNQNGILAERRDGNYGVLTRISHSLSSMKVRYTFKVRTTGVTDAGKKINLASNYNGGSTTLCSFSPSSEWQTVTFTRRFSEITVPEPLLYFSNSAGGTALTEAEAAALNIYYKDLNEENLGIVPDPTEHLSVPLTPETVYASGCLENGDGSPCIPTYAPDGSVAFTTSNQYSGGGMAFYLKSDKSPVDLSGYSGVKIVVEGTADRQLVIGAFDKAAPDNYLFTATVAGTTKYEALTGSEQEINVDFGTATAWGAIDGAYAILVKYNGHGAENGNYDGGDKRYTTVKIKSITFIAKGAPTTPAPSSSAEPVESGAPSSSADPEESGAPSSSAEPSESGAPEASEAPEETPTNLVLEGESLGAGADFTYVSGGGAAKYTPVAEIKLTGDKFVSEPSLSLTWEAKDKDNNDITSSQQFYVTVRKDKADHTGTEIAVTYNKTSLSSWKIQSEEVTLGDLTANDNIYIVIATSTDGFDGTFTLKNATLDSEVLTCPAPYTYKEAGMAQWAPTAKVELPADIDFSKYSTCEIEYEVTDDDNTGINLQAIVGATNSAAKDVSDPNYTENRASGKYVVTLDNVKKLTTFTAPYVKLQTAEKGFTGAVKITKITFKI